MQLSRYFTLENLTYSDTALRQGINNTPDTFSQANLGQLAVLLDQIYDQIGPFRISSGYRSPELNAAIGGAEGSLHQRGMAADLIPETMSADAFFWKLSNSPLKNSCGEIINEASEKGVVHVSLPYTDSGGIYRTGYLKYMKGSSYYVYTPAEINARLSPGSSSTSVSFEAPSFPIIPVMATAALLGGIAFMATMQSRKA